MLKSLLLLLVVACVTAACSVYYQPHGRRGGTVEIKIPDKPEIKPMPAPDAQQDKQKNKKAAGETKTNPKQS